MKTVAAPVDSRSNMSGNERIKMGIDPQGIAHIINMVTHLYADEGSACIREYAANAYDSHVLAKQKRPIEVTLPTLDRPNLVFTDYGVGMSKADITDVFSLYGASTKRESDELIGAMGLGCKAGLSLAPSFTLTAVKDGRKTVAIIHRGADGVGEIEFVHESDTTDHSGVTVTIAIHDDPKSIKSYKAKARAIFVTWPVGSVLVDGEAPEMSIGNDEHFVKIGDYAYLSRKSTTTEEDRLRYWRTPQNGSMIVTMGGIGYYVDREQMSELLGKMKTDDLNQNMRNFVDSFKRAVLSSLTLVVDVPMGSVDLISSRESVRWSGRSVKTVVDILNKVVRQMPTSLAEDFKACKTRFEVLSKETQEFASVFRSVYAEVEWQGEKLPRAIKFSLPTQENYYDQGADNFIFRYQGNGERIPVLRNTTAPTFDFGFLENTRSYGNAEADSKHWFFTTVNSTEEVKSKVSAFANTFVEDLRAEKDVPYGAPVQIVASVGNIFENKWLKELFDNSSNMHLVEVDDLVERSRSRRRITAAANRTARVRNNVKMELTYPTIIIGDNGELTVHHLSTKAIDELSASTGGKVFLDDNDLITQDGTSYYTLSAMKEFISPKSIIVGMKSNRKFSALVARIESETHDLTADITANMNAFVKTVTLEEYVSLASPYKSWSSPNIDASKLKNGFIKDMLTDTTNDVEKYARIRKLHVVKSRGVTYLSKENAGWDKELAKVEKKIAEACVLVFGSSRSYRVDEKAYNKALIAYLNTLNPVVEKLVK